MIFAHTPSEILPYRKCLQTEFLGDGFNNICGSENDKMGKVMAELSVPSEFQNSQETLTKNQQKLEQSISEIHNNRMQSDQHKSQQQDQEQQQNQQQHRNKVISKDETEITIITAVTPYSEFPSSKMEGTIILATIIIIIMDVISWT